MRATQAEVKKGGVGVAWDGGVSWDPRGVEGKVGEEVVAGYFGGGVHQMTRRTVAFVGIHKSGHAVSFTGGELSRALYKAIVFGIEGIQESTGFKGGNGFSNLLIRQGGVAKNSRAINGFELIGIGRLCNLGNHLCTTCIVHFKRRQEGGQGLLLQVGGPTIPKQATHGVGVAIFDPEGEFRHKGAVCILHGVSQAQ